MQDMCGLGLFATEYKPDQWYDPLHAVDAPRVMQPIRYRLLLGFFLHSGIVHVILVVLLEWNIVVDVERVGHCMHTIPYDIILSDHADGRVVADR